MKNKKPRKFLTFTKFLMKEIFLGEYCYRLENVESLYTSITYLYGIDHTCIPYDYCVSLAHRALSLKEIQECMFILDPDSKYRRKDFKLSAKQIYKILKFEMDLKSIYKTNSEKYIQVIKELEQCNQPLSKRLFL